MLMEEPKRAIIKSMRDLLNAGLTKEQIIALGGKISGSGANVTFVEGDPGFEGIVRQFHMKLPAARQPKDRKKCGGCSRAARKQQQQQQQQQQQGNNEGTG
jgi:hypothetical protein